MSFSIPLQALPLDHSFYGVGSALLNDAALGNCRSIKLTGTLELEPVHPVQPSDPKHVWRIREPKLVIDLHDLTATAQQILVQGLVHASLEVRLHNLADTSIQGLQVVAACDVPPTPEVSLLADDYWALSLTCYCYATPAFTFF